MNFQTMSKQRKGVLIAAAVGIISMFLPWVSISIAGFGASANGMHGSGILVFLCFVAAGVLAYMGNQTTNLPQTTWMITLVAGAVATLIMVINFFDASGSGLLSIGFYGALLASIAVLVCAFLFRTAGQSLQSGFDSLKNDFNQKVNTTSTNTHATGTTTTVSTSTTNDESAKTNV